MKMNKFLVFGFFLLFMISGCFSGVNDINSETEEIRYEEQINDSRNISQNITRDQSQIKIYYKSNFQKTFAFYNSSGTWTTLPGIEIANSSSKEGYKEISVPSNAISIMFNDGNNTWDSIGKRKVIYFIRGNGEFVIENHSIKKLKSFKTKYGSMNIKGNFSNNLPLPMKLTADYLWETIIYGDTSFVFDVYGNNQTVFGDNNNDNIADLIAFPINIDSNKYKVTFNEKTNVYKLEKLEIIPQVVTDFKASVDNNYNVTITFNSPMPEKPDGVKIYKSLTKDGVYELVTDIPFTNSKWQEDFGAVSFLNVTGNDKGLIYYMTKSYVGEKESLSSEIIELKVEPSHNPLQMLEDFTGSLSPQGYASFSWSYTYKIKPNGFRIYKSSTIDGTYSKVNEIKFEQTSQSIGGYISSAGLGQGNDQGYYYAVPFIGNTEGEPTKPIDLTTP